MMTHSGQMKGKALFALVPVLALVVLAGFALISCDPGDSPDPPTGPNSTYDPIFDDPQPGITARVSPNPITVPDPVTLDVGRAVILAKYRDPSGNPRQGLQMNFTSDPVSSNISFIPPASFTDGNGTASAEVIVAVGTPTGSFALVAYTSPASAGPNEQGQTTLKVVEGEFVTTPSIPSGDTAPVDTNPLVGVTASADYITGGSSSNLSGTVDIQYRFDCGGFVQGWRPVGTTSDTCNFNSAGSKSIRAQARTFTSMVESRWSDPLSVTITDSVPTP
jgi:hypothetical protein